MVSFVIYFFLNNYYIYGKKIDFQLQNLIDIRQHALTRLATLEKEINELNQKIQNEANVNQNIIKQKKLQKELENIKIYNVVLLKIYTNGQTTKTEKE